MAKDVVEKLWETVGDCRELHAVLEAVFPLLKKQLHLAGIVVRRVDVQASAVETIDHAADDDSADVSTLPLGSVPRDAMDDLLRWTRGHVALHSGSRSSSDLLPILAPDRGDPIVCLPFATADSETQINGAIVLIRSSRTSKLDDKLLRDLARALAVAVRNDHAWRELRARAEALEADNRALLTRLERQDISDSVVGAEAGLKHVMERVDQVGRSDVPVLIFGETGSGKEVVARAIHTRSMRASGPILRVNCGAIPPDLIDSELFGHERGSFTGATSTRKGWFERADQGTLFLDEVGELPLAAQVRMLRILQDGTFERVGGHRTSTVDVRVIAATNRDLHSMVSEGTFREDLWYRLSVFPIHLPALRDRRSDIPSFATQFAARAGKRLAGHPLVPSPQDIELLLNYEWPGNVRELAAVIERAAILGDGKRLDVAQALGARNPVAPKRFVQSFRADERIPEHAVRERHAQSSPAVVTANASENNRREPDASAILVVDEADRASSMQQSAERASLDDAMRIHIESTLRGCHGRIEGPFGAAKLLKINPYTLRSRMKKLGIDWRVFRQR